MKGLICVMYGLGGAALDPAGGEAVLVQKIKALGIDTAGSPYQYSDTSLIAGILLAAHAKGLKVGVGGDSLGANNAPYVAQSVRTHMGVDYLFGFQPSEYGMHQPVTKNVIEAFCTYNPNWLETFGLGAYAWQLETGNTRTRLTVVTNNDAHPGDDDVVSQNIILADIKRIFA